MYLVGYKQDLRLKKQMPKSNKKVFLYFFLQNKSLVIGFGITNKTISDLKLADGLVVGSQLCKTISNSIKKRQNPVTNISKLVYNLKNKIL